MDRRNKGGSAVLSVENKVLLNLIKAGKNKKCLIDDKIRYETMLFFKVSLDLKDNSIDLQVKIYQNGTARFAF
jgi:hypothetical protein